MSTEPNDQIEPISEPDEGGMADFMDTLQSIDESSPEASLNETSIDDNNGGRIELGEEPSNVIKK